ncbi:unnamed protein product [Sphenostylis stenocarpa]|uniref:TIR domain-containing protein n=1 Tax=Sphenostylis stenocarpa TaxID=92480 RepID=A0AA87B982_9FABA|nr:unnamed protein product [Sphenostylis stenocarpa]
MACRQIQRSSSSRTKNFDVFVSFRGEDTRNGFTDHLFAALRRKGVVAFRDDQTIKKGEFLESELLRAIEGSRVFIVVFSKDYASSTWCMKELTKIVETGRSLLPIFYDVTPSEVRKQSGEFAEAFAQHEERFKDDLEMLQKWREALKTSGDRCGWDIQNKQQNEEIENIVEEVINILGYNQILSFGDDFVDMHSRVKQMEELLDLGANDVVGLVGILKKLLDYREFHPDIGMKVLIEKSLISCRDRKIQMHDLLQELGKSIVREEAPKEPRKWSRLWDYKDLQKAMKINTEAKNLAAIVIEQRPEEFLQERIRVDALSKINHLELLILQNVNTFGSLNCISNELRYLNWDNFPFVSLPSTFEPDQLVELQLRYSNIKKLWEGTKILPKLRTLDLSHSKNLIEMPDLTGVPHLTTLRLEGCIELVQIDPSIGILRELVYLQRTISSAKTEIVIPGTQIPEWFNKQNARSSISVDLSSVMDDPNWIGVAFCVLFVTHQDPTNLSERRNGHRDCIAYGVHNKHLFRKGYLFVPIHFKEDLVAVELDHLFTVFYSREEFIGLLTQDPDKMLDPAKLEFEIISNNSQGLRIVVKNCGYRWVFKEDLQQLHLMFGRNSSSQKSKHLRSD